MSEELLQPLSLLALLHLGNNRLTSFAFHAIPSSLTSLKLQDNLLYGPSLSLYPSLSLSPDPWFPTENITRLNASSLSILHLGHNRLYGSLDGLAASRQLLFVDLSGNAFSGSIPSAFLSHASALTALNLAHNNLTGTVPAGIARHAASLLRLDLSHNALAGTCVRGSHSPSLTMSV